MKIAVEKSSKKKLWQASFLLLSHSFSLVFAAVKRIVPTTIASISRTVYHVLIYVNVRAEKMIATTEMRKTKIIFTLRMIITMETKACFRRELLNYCW